MNKRINKRIYFIVVLILFCGCNKSQKKYVSFEKNFNEAKDVDYVLQGIELIANKDKKKLWDFYADKAFIFEKEKCAQASNVKINFYQKNKEVSVLTSKFGKFYLNTNDIVLWDDVIVISSDKTKIKTKSLKYKANEEQFTTNDFVQAYLKNGNVLSGYEMLADLKLEAITIFKPQLNP